MQQIGNTDALDNSKSLREEAEAKWVLVACVARPQPRRGVRQTDKPLFAGVAQATLKPRPLVARLVLV